jgi:hypothetical protein
MDNGVHLHTITTTDGSVYVCRPNGGMLSRVPTSAAACPAPDADRFSHGSQLLSAEELMGSDSPFVPACTHRPQINAEVSLLICCGACRRIN